MMKHVLFSLLTLSPFFLQASRADPDYEHIFLNEDECTLEEIFEEEIAEAEIQEKPSLTAYANDPMPSSSCPKKNLCRVPSTCPGLFSRFEFLYWKLDETGMDFGVHKHEGTAVYYNPFINDTIDQWVGTVHMINFDWNPGFRVGLGYRFSRDLWELEVAYTYYYTSGSDKVKVNHFYGDSNARRIADSEALCPTVPRNIDLIILMQANAHFWYHVGDLVLARQFALTPYISGRFTVGPTCAFIQQKFHIKMADHYFTDYPPARAIPSQFEFEDFNWKFSGGGLKLNFNTHWLLGCGWNLIFGGGISSFYGLYENKMKGHIQASQVPGLDIPGSVGGLVADTTIKQGRVVYASEVEGGIAWNFTSCNKWKVEIYAKYELNTWFNLTDQYRVDVGSAAQSTGNKLRDLQTPPLNLQGLTAGISFNF